MSALTSKTYFPPTESPSGLEEVANYMDAYKERHGVLPEPQFFLTGPTAGDHVPLPKDVYEVLVDVVQAMRDGLAVTIRPSTERVTTQQAADILGVSRPTVVRLIDNGTLPAEKVGRHRRIRLIDVISHQKLQADTQLDAIISTSDLDSELPDTTFFKEIRFEVARKRRTPGV